MAESLLERSTRYIDGSVYEGPRTINPITARSTRSPTAAMVCGFSHIWTLDTGTASSFVTPRPGYASVAVEHVVGGPLRSSTRTAMWTM